MVGLIFGIFLGVRARHRRRHSLVLTSVVTGERGPKPKLATEPGGGGERDGSGGAKPRVSKKSSKGKGFKQLTEDPTAEDASELVLSEPRLTDDLQELHGLHAHIIELTRELGGGGEGAGNGGGDGGGGEGGVSLDAPARKTSSAARAKPKVSKKRSKASRFAQQLVTVSRIEIA